MSEMQYYEVRADDKSHADRWFLGEPYADAKEEIDARLFRYGQPYTGPSPIRIPILKDGTAVAFSLAAFDMPVVSDAVRKAVGAITSQGYDLFPVAVDSRKDAYWILNVNTAIACVDEARSEVQKWAASDGRPDRIGAYRSIVNLKIDPSRSCGDIFRVKGWEVALVVSDNIRHALEGISNLGIIFKPLT